MNQSVNALRPVFHRVDLVVVAKLVLDETLHAREIRHPAGGRAQRGSTWSSGNSGSRRPPESGSHPDGPQLVIVARASQAWVQQSAGICPKSSRDGFARDCPLRHLFTITPLLSVSYVCYCGVWSPTWSPYYCARYKEQDFARSRSDPSDQRTLSCRIGTLLGSLVWREVRADLAAPSARLCVPAHRGGTRVRGDHGRRAGGPDPDLARQVPDRTTGAPAGRCRDGLRRPGDVS